MNVGEDKQAHPQEEASIMDPDGLADMAVHGTSARVVGHGVRFIHQTVRVGNDVDKRECKLLVAYTW